ncbi:MAG: hypothetical protein RIS88_1532 [Pseudomonadota bacterium]
MESGLSALDWSGPWYAPWRVAGQAVAGRIAQGLAAHEALNRQAGPHPVRFVPQQALPADTAYERFVFEQRQCPTREGLHDFFNGLCWLHFPKAKRQLNALQAAQIAAHGVGAVRGPLRDAITVFDENGALLDAPTPLWEALAARQWRRLFIDLRPLWVQARLVVFGHALLEKLAVPRKDLTAHVWHGPSPLGSMQAADAWLAAACTGERLAAKPFLHLPVLGVPGWWQANADAAFYDDAAVFRAARSRGGPLGGRPRAGHR